MGVNAGMFRVLENRMWFLIYMARNASFSRLAAVTYARVTKFFAVEVANRITHRVTWVLLRRC